MAQYCILGKRINKLSIPKTYDINKIQLGVVVIVQILLERYAYSEISGTSILI